MMKIENKYKLNERVVNENTTRLLRERKTLINEIMTAKESEDVIADLINSIVDKSSMPAKYKGRGFESLYDSLKPYAESHVELYGKKKLATSDFWRNITNKSVDTSKTDIKGNKNYSVKYGPAQLMSGVVSEAEATFLAAAEKSGLSSVSKGIVLDMLEGLSEYSGKTIGPDMDITTLKKSKNVRAIKDKVNKRAYNLVMAAEKLQKGLKDQMNNLFENNSKFQSEFIFEAMTGASKFSDSTAIADTMLCINKNATKVKIEVVTSPTDSYVQKVVAATKIDVNFKTGSYDIAGKKAGYSFAVAMRLGTKDLSEAITEMNEAIDKHDGELTEGFFDFLSPILDKIKKVWDNLKNIFLKLIQLVQKGFQYILSVFDLVPTVTGWQELNSIDLYDYA